MNKVFLVQAHEGIMAVSELCPLVFEFLWNPEVKDLSWLDVFLDWGMDCPRGLVSTWSKSVCKVILLLRV